MSRGKHKQEIELDPLPSAGASNTTLPLSVSTPEAAYISNLNSSSTQKLNASLLLDSANSEAHLRLDPEAPTGLEETISQIDRIDDITSGNRHVPVEALPPVDGGSKAWLFLIGATYMEIIVWGLPFSIGVLHAYWSNVLFKGEGLSTITLAATLQTGLLYMFAALFGPIFAAIPKWTRALQIAGLAAASLAMIASAFATKPWHLLVTVGLFYPLSCATYLPCATLLFEWFHAKRGYATGIMYAGSGAGGTIFPFLMQGLLSRFGYKAAMISLGVGYGITGSIALIPIKRRVPLLARHDTVSSSRERQRPKVDWSFLKRKSLAIGTTVILLTSLGNFIPSLWLPSYADDLSLHSPDGTSLIAILNASSVVGNGLLGYLSDRMSLRSVVLISCVGSAASCAFLWGFAGDFSSSRGVLVAFSIIYGLLGPSFSSCWSKMIGLASSTCFHLTTPRFLV
ncbi:monocarboxylic acid transporter [Kwoniella heveanensis CBS 569]|nr:monocarboxylic acid transporter [Kwoniella heveanensis CBS 569]